MTTWERPPPVYVKGSPVPLRGRVELHRFSVDCDNGDIHLLKVLREATGAGTRGRLIRWLLRVWNEVLRVRQDKFEGGPEGVKLALVRLEPLLDAQGNRLLTNKGVPRWKYNVQEVGLPEWPK